MAVPTTSWSETTPAGSDALAQGDNRLREMKTQIREVIGVDHDFPSSGSASDNGQHLRVTLQEQANLGTGAVGTTILGSQTVSGRGELVYTNEDNVDIQLTSGSNIHAPSLGGTYPAASLSVLSNILPYIYPIGIIIELGVSTNPNTLLGFGTWAAYGTGRVTVAIDAGQTEFDTLDETGGAKTHTLDISEIPDHTHSINVYPDPIGGGGGSDLRRGETTGATGSAGGGGAHNNLQPYIVVYRWKRTA